MAGEMADEDLTVLSKFLNDLTIEKDDHLLRSVIKENRVEILMRMFEILDMLCISIVAHKLMIEFEVARIKGKMNSDRMSATEALLDALLSKDFKILVNFLKLMLGTIDENIAGYRDVVRIVSNKMDEMKKRESTTRDTFSIPNEEVKVEEKEKFKGSDNVHIVKYKHLKYLSKDFPLNPKEEKKNCYLMIFFKDVQNWTKLSHPNIVQIFGLFQRTPKQLAFICEYLPMSLEYFLKNNKTLRTVIPLKLKCTILSDVCQAMMYLHGQAPPIIHRDLKPENIYLTSSFRAKVSGLGRAKYFKPEKDKLTDLPKSPYLPPEVFKGEYNLTVDCFSFGCLIIAVITHEPPSKIDADETLREAKAKFNEEEKDFIPLVQNCLASIESQHSFDDIYASLTERDTYTDEDIMNLLRVSFENELNSSRQEPVATSNITSKSDPPEPSMTHVQPTQQNTDPAPAKQTSPWKCGKSTKWIFVVFPILVGILAVLVYFILRFQTLLG